MTTAKQKSVRDFRGRFKKKRYASPAEARQIFDRMYERGDREREAHLRTPEGERERQAHNAALFKKNPRVKLSRITSGEASQILSSLSKEGADFHSLTSDEVHYLLASAKEVGYRAPKGASGSKARSFYAYLEKRAKGAWQDKQRPRTIKNPVRKWIIEAIQPRPLHFWYWSGTWKKDRSDAISFLSEKAAYAKAQTLRDTNNLPTYAKALRAVPA
jgi:hypothetical protein